MASTSSTSNVNYAVGTQQQAIPGVKWTIRAGNNPEITESVTANEILFRLGSIIPTRLADQDTADEFKIQKAFTYLSKIQDFKKNSDRSMIASRLRVFILTFAKQNPRRAEICAKISDMEEFRGNKNVEDVAKKIQYIAKSKFDKYVYNLNKEPHGISPVLFLFGLGLIFSGALAINASETIDDEAIAKRQASFGWIQVATGAAMVVTPFFKAGLKTVWK